MTQLNEDQRTTVNNALLKYGARLAQDDHIAKGEKVLSVHLAASKGTNSGAYADRCFAL
jgi:hypothetical protein